MLTCQAIQLFAISSHMVHVAYGMRVDWYQLLDALFPCQEGQSAEILSVKAQQVKRIKPRLFTVVHQMGKDRAACLIWYGDLSVEDGLIYLLVPSQLFSQSAKAIELTAFSREKPCLAMLDDGECPPAVILQLEKPVRSSNGSLR